MEKIKVTEKLVGVYAAKGHVVEIWEGSETWDAWITRNSFGIKSYMFGAMKADTSYGKFVDIVETNLDDYIEIFCDEYGYPEDHEEVR